MDWSKCPKPSGKYWHPHVLELNSIDNMMYALLCKQSVRDGVRLDAYVKNEYYPTFDIKYKVTGYFVWLFPEMERFLLRYLCIGINTGFPSYPDNWVKPPTRDTKDYIFRHIKRELGRNRFTVTDEIKDGVNGISFIAEYPYGSINYGFLPYSWDELNNMLETIEPYDFTISEIDIPELHNNKLPIEYREFEEGKHLDDVFEDKLIPTNIILDKTVCGCGATYMEIEAERHSIIIEPNVPVIMGKEQQHPNIIGIYGDAIKAKDIVERIEAQKGWIKIMTTPDSYPKAVKALKSLRIPYLTTFFLLFDECEKIVSDIDYRQTISLPIDDFFKFRNKAMVSATPIVINDPRFENQDFKIVKIKPLFDHRKLLELKPTNNVNVMVKNTISKINSDVPVCFFYNSINGIKELIEHLDIEDNTNIYCSTEAKKELRRAGYENVFDTVIDKTGATTLNRYNFFTSRFYSAVDIKLDCRPIVIMITQVYKTIKDKMPFTLIDPETEAIQIAGRFRNGIERLIHITNTDPDMPFQSREELEQFFSEEHSVYLQLLKMKKEISTNGGQYLIEQAIERNDYRTDGFVSGKGEINYFRYNNAYIDERLKMIYHYSTTLNKAYNRTNAFIVVSGAEFAAYTDKERETLLNKNNPKRERIKLLNDIIIRAKRTDNIYCIQFIEELKSEYELYIDALTYLGFRRVKKLQFNDYDIRAELNQAKFEYHAKSDKVKEAVYGIFNENTIYTVKRIKDELDRIFKDNKVELSRRPQGKDIFLYFNGEEGKGTRGVRICRLGAKL